MEQAESRSCTALGGCCLDLGEVVVRPVRSWEEARYQELMQQYHYLGALPKISETLWYVATWREEWVALLSFSASALKCAARDRWIGWDLRQRYSRLKLVVNNSRFLILPDGHVPNLGSRVLSLCQRRLGRDWQATFGHSVLLLETFVDPQRFRGTVYRAANWVYVGSTRGFRRTRYGYTATPQSPKSVFLQPLRADARRWLCGAILPPPYRIGDAKIMLTAAQMQSLPSFFSQIPDPRRAQKGIAVRALSRPNSRRRFAPYSCASISDRIQSATKGHAAFSIASVQSVRRRAPRRRHLVGTATRGFRHADPPLGFPAACRAGDRGVPRRCDHSHAGRHGGAAP